MAEIKTKKYNRVKQDYKAGAVKTAVARILKNSKKGYDYNKLKVYGLLFQKNISGALKAAGGRVQVRSSSRHEGPCQRSQDNYFAVPISR